ncbi:hypothetical protein JL722_5705 [Aureococcus anophagefferens]|nr:hypothetical protein JL722_5705 [Aureococcus anophagefferens]
MFNVGATPRSAPTVIVILRDGVLQARMFECLSDADARCAADGTFAKWKEYGLWSSVRRIREGFENDPAERARLLPNLAAVPTVAEPAAAYPPRPPAAVILVPAPTLAVVTPAAAQPPPAPVTVVATPVGAEYAYS